MKTVIILTLLLFNSTISKAFDVVEFNIENNKINIGINLLQYIDSTNQLKINEILTLFKNDKFNKSHVEIPNFKQNKSKLWFSFQIKNNTKKTLYLSINNPHIDSFNLFQIQTDKIINLGYAGDKIDLKNRAIKDNRILIKLPTNYNESNTFIFSIKKGASVKIPISIITTKHLIENGNTEKLISGIYFGAYITLLLISIIVYIITRDKIYILYFFYILIFSNYLFNELGYGYLYFWEELNDLKLSVRVMLGVFTTPTIVIFSTEFLRMKKHFPKARKVLNTVSLLIIIEILLSNTIGLVPNIYYNTQLAINHILIIILLVSLIIMTIKSFKVQKTESIIIFFSVLTVLLGSLIFILSEHKLIPSNHFTLYASIWFSLIDILIISIGLSIRINEIFVSKMNLGQQIIEQQKQLLSAIITGEEKERKRLARELHDGISGNLVSLSLKIKADSKKEIIEKLTQDTLREVRHISHKLIPPQFDKRAIDEIISDYIRTIKNEHKFKIQFITKGDFKLLGNEYKITLYRIIQESISNTSKYANSKTLIIQLFKIENEVTISIEDDGNGFDINTHTDGIGLINMESRVKELKGEFSIDSSSEHGTLITISFEL